MGETESLPALESFDPKHPDFMNDPWRFYARLRDEAPVYQEPRSGIFFVANYELAEQVMRNPELFSSRVDRAAMRSGGMPARVLEIRKAAWPIALTMSQNDAPSHDVYRALIAHFFLPRNLTAIEPFIESRTEELIAKIAAQDGVCEFLAEFAVPLPISVIGRYLGLQDYGWDTLKRWSDAFADEIGFLTSDDRAVEIAELTLACHQAMMETAEARRTAPQDDIISHLAAAKIENGRLLEPGEILSILTQLLVAGNETTTNTLAGALKRLALAPELAEKLRAEPRLITAFVEEVLRLESPVQGQFRKTTRETVLGGVTLPEGALLHVRFASVNRDKAAFGARADEVHVGGKPLKPHMSFGLGLHFCVGAMLSRLELRIALTRILAHFGSISLAVPASDLVYHTHFHLRGLKRLPLRFA